MSNQGGGTSAVNVSLTFDDEAAGNVVPSVTGTYRPTPGTYSHTVPTGPFGTQLSAFDGTNGNGTWSLYVFDGATSDVGSIAGGWSLSIATNQPVCSSGCAFPVELLDFSVDGSGMR